MYSAFMWNKLCDSSKVMGKVLQIGYNHGIINAQHLLCFIFSPCRSANHRFAPCISDKSYHRFSKIYGISENSTDAVRLTGGAFRRRRNADDASIWENDMAAAEALTGRTLPPECSVHFSQTDRHVSLV